MRKKTYKKLGVMIWVMGFLFVIGFLSTLINFSKNILGSGVLLVCFCIGLNTFVNVIIFYMDLQKQEKK